MKAAFLIIRRLIYEMQWHFSQLKRREPFVFVKDVVSEFLRDNCPHLAASISYYTLLCFFPLTLALFSVIGLVFHSSALEAQLIEHINNSLPTSGEFIADTIRGLSAAWQATGIVGIVGLCLAGLGVFNAIRKSVNTAWGVQPRSFFIERVKEVLMMIGTGFLLFSSFALTTTLSVFHQLNLPFLGIEFLNGALLWQIMLALLTASLAFITFLFLFRFIPNAQVSWGDVWPGALAAAIAFEIGKQIFVWYTTNFSHYNLIYGPVGTIIVLLVWVYISAIIVLFCAKVTSVMSRRKFWAAEAEKRKFSQVEIPGTASQFDCQKENSSGKSEDKYLPKRNA